MRLACWTLGFFLVFFGANARADDEYGNPTVTALSNAQPVESSVDSYVSMTLGIVTFEERAGVGSPVLFIPFGLGPRSAS